VSGATNCEVKLRQATNQKGANKKMWNSRHIPCPDWIQNVTGTCQNVTFECTYR